MNSRVVVLLSVVCLFGIIGCESVNKGANVAGQGVGKVMKVGDSLNEGAVDGYLGKEKPEDNPYNR